MYRCILALLAAVCPAFAEQVLYACASSTKEYVVGAKLPLSGLFRRSGSGEWKHAGFNHPWVLGIAALDPRTLLIAAGNGLIRATDEGAKWTIVTGSDVTELRDVTVSNGVIYFAHSAGIRASSDRGETWRELSGGLRRPYTESIRAVNGKLVAGGESGVFQSGDSGKTWQLSGAAGFQIMRIAASPHDRCVLIASTQGGGLFQSNDCGKTFEAMGRIGFGHNTYDVDFDPGTRGQVAAAIWGVGIAVSTDNGKSWSVRNAGLPGSEVSTVVFDPHKPGRLFTAVRQQGVFVSENAGLNWTKDGLGDTHVNILRFVEEGAK